MTDEVINNGPDWAKPAATQDDPELVRLLAEEEEIERRVEAAGQRAQLDQEAAERKLVVAFVDRESAGDGDLRHFLYWLRGRVGDEVLAQGVEFATQDRPRLADDYSPGDRVRYRSYLADGGIGTIDYIDPDGTIYVHWDGYESVQTETAADIKPA